MNTRIAEIGQQMVLLGTYDDFDLDQIFEVLVASDVAYHEDGEAFVGDGDYDGLRKYAHLYEPHNAYFTGVGSDVRGGKIPLPYPMGSLDQIEVGQIEKWIESNNLYDESLVATDKLDGISAMLVYGEDGVLQIAYSRGDGTKGADITRHVKHFVPEKIDNGGESFVIRGEVIISKAKFPIVQTKTTTSNGKQYKNARNMVAGCMNASERDPTVYEYIDFVAYQIVSPGDVLDYYESLLLLRRLGFGTVEAPAIFHGDEIDDEGLSSILNSRRVGASDIDESPYEIDGLVICVDSLAKRKQLTTGTRNSLNPEFAIKYKVQDASNLAIATVIEVEWNASKHGYLKPRVRVEPIQLVGVTIQHATGFNAKFIHDNGIGPGAQVQITRSGDVIPFIQEVTLPTTAQMPSVGWTWNLTGVDAEMTG